MSFYPCLVLHSSPQQAAHDTALWKPSSSSGFASKAQEKTSHELQEEQVWTPQALKQSWWLQLRSLGTGQICSQDNCGFLRFSTQNTLKQQFKKPLCLHLGKSALKIIQSQANWEPAILCDLELLMGDVITGANAIPQKHGNKMSRSYKICVFLPNSNRPIPAGQLPLRRVYNWWRSQEITKKITGETKSFKKSNLFFSQAFIKSRSAGFLGSKWEIGTTALLGKETEGVFSGTTNQSHFGPLSVRLKFSSIGYWSWLHGTQPWCISWLTSSAVCFWQTKSPSLQVDKKYIYQ